MSSTLSCVDDQTSREGFKELRVYRRLLAIAGAVYLLWWPAVELTLPTAFNPFFGRFLVVAFAFVIIALSYLNDWARRNLRSLFMVCVWLITFHYYYLFYGNGGDPNWVIGSFITVMAINFCFFSNAALLAYSLFVAFLSFLIVVFVPTLERSVFLPGIVTILVQANLGLRSRLGLIKTLASSNARFELLFNSTFEGVLVHQDGRITDVNDALAEMLGTTRGELIGKEVLSIISPDDRTLVFESMSTSNLRPYETRGLKKDGSMVDIEVRAKNFTRDDQTARLVAIKDITDRKKAEKERIAALTMQENVRVRDDFISIASHELKTPISALKLQTQLIKRDLKRHPSESYAPAKIHEFIDIFNRQVDRLLELVETMLDVSRISANRLVLDLQDVDLAAIAREVVADLRIRDLHEEGVPSMPSIEMGGLESAIVRGDRSRLQQVVENLFSNAIKYGNGKPIRVEMKKEQGRVLLVVEDHGLGIASDFMEKIFDRFERAISPRNISGLGLGLYIARQIVEAHGGHIWVESHLGAGSIFTVELPAASLN